MRPDARPTGAPPRVAVIVLGWSDYPQRYLADCYASLRAQTYAPERFTVFIVNNGWDDAGQRAVDRLAGGARILHAGGNLGWSGGTNLALRIALAEGFEYLVMLNIDTRVDPAWLERLVEAAESRPDVHVLQSTILLEGTTRINSAGNTTHFLGFGYCRGYGRELGAGRADAPPDFASGASLLVKRRVFDAVGLFREEYMMYYDDMEFSWRARLAGFNIGVADASLCYHKYQFQRNPAWLYYRQRNRWLTLLTLEKRRTLLVIAPVLLLGECVLTGYFLARGWGEVQLRLARHFLHPDTWRSIRTRRRQVARMRTRRDAEIVRAFAGRIVFPEIAHPLLRYLINPVLAGYWSLVRRLIVW